MNRLENKLDRDSAVKQLRRGGTKLRHFEIVIDCQGDMRAVSEAPAEDDAKCGGFILQGEKRRGITPADP